MLVSIDEEKYSLVLEYADCGTLGKYLRDDTMTFNWENQLRLQVRFYGYMIIPIIALIHQDAIKLSDFCRSFEKGKGCNDTGVYGVIPYVDSNMLNREIFIRYSGN
ncbi:uncharacterized protein OCT59_024396 [Rhizophagus irregularis]|uniref:Protein kinase domain-containing protein n=1 Tax=Rhizophagus irregularis (strain DAOM 181602 / DAOM 197198 / MUCL 43194) TaxID=747089 RepID=A0A2P4PJY0_RHIID|nr:hypothetical protein GLOIN_2v1781443 [Rhizophagus irregularis DAOM 181602=DAOM 197198]POG65694.1 hypothetical protein GLOIN_2v1781443 [Rhizophagus irregularis DAOM 181602=DAOM 197198]UZO03997.1 hypothetical protein OCT59_024396 [Rhizophagus irregularis]|eukprot:XP_025172560.1 hypothetical protein GLOIN_2v1781443 [Rhizophagus irregularis DAOM 181602=DAOM 197198]